MTLWVNLVLFRGISTIGFNVESRYLPKQGVYMLYQMCHPKQYNTMMLYDLENSLTYRKCENTLYWLPTKSK